MQICPNCARELDDRDILCAFCGHTGKGAGAGAGSAPVQPVVTVAPADAAASTALAVVPVVPTKAATKPGKATRSNAIANAALAVTAIAMVSTVIFVARSSRSGVQATTQAAPVTSATVASAPVASAPATPARSAAVSAPPAVQPDSSAPKWTRTRQSGWATDGSRTMGFEVDAEREVPVYMDRVRPVLAARCISRQIEVFVVLRSATRIENRDTRTARISVDGEPEVEQQWLESSDRQGLFAPDARAFATRLATANRLRFGFNPFNAPAATAEFDVHGFAGPLETMARTCRLALQLTSS
jgi:hypothetical protein